MAPAAAIPARAGGAPYWLPTAIVKNWRADVLQETLQFSPLEIRSDKDIMIEAVKNDSIAFEFCSDEL